MANPISSDDGRLKIIRHSLLYPSMGPKAVQGAIKNVSASTVSAEIRAEFRDDSGRALGTVGITVENLAPDETRLFDVWAERLPDMYEVEGYEIVSLKVIS